MDNYLIYVYKIIKYFFLFPTFPNPHFRTTNFLISSSDFLKYDFKTDVDSKEKAWCIESGKESYNFFQKKNSMFMLLIQKINFLQKMIT